MSKGLTQIQGFEQLREQIKKLPDKVKRNELQKVLRQVAKPTVREAQFQAPIRDFNKKGPNPPGTLKRSIGVKNGKKGKSKINAVVYVGPRTKGSNKGWYGHLVELGHNIYSKGFKRVRKAGANNQAAKKRTKANPFMDRAYKITKGKVSAESEKQVARYIQKQINRLSK